MAIGSLAFKSARVLPCLAIAGRAAITGDSEVFRACSTPVTDLSKPQKAVNLVSWLLQCQQHKVALPSACPSGMLSQSQCSIARAPGNQFAILSSEHGGSVKAAMCKLLH